MITERDWSKASERLGDKERSSFRKLLDDYEELARRYLALREMVGVAREIHVKEIAMAGVAIEQQREEIKRLRADKEHWEDGWLRVTTHEAAMREAIECLLRAEDTEPVSEAIRILRAALELPTEEQAEAAALEKK